MTGTVRATSPQTEEDGSGTDAPVVWPSGLEDRLVVQALGGPRDYIVFDASLVGHEAHQIAIALVGKSYAFAGRPGLGLSGIFFAGNVMSEGTAVTSPETDVLTYVRAAYETHSASTIPDAAGIRIAALKPWVTTVLENAEYEDLEIGVASIFSQRLSEFIDTYGVSAIDALREALETRLPSSVVMSVLLRELGGISDGRTRRQRRDLLSSLLRSNSVQVRYAASAGLAALDDPEAIPALERALASETHARPQEQLQLVLDQLRDTRRVSLSHR